MLTKTKCVKCHRQSSDDFKMCKSCRERHRSAVKRSTARHREVARAKWRRYVRKHSAEKVASNLARHLLHPEKNRARSAVRRAVISGRLTIPVLCEDCRSICKLQAHHDDYSQPLDVIWLCSPCHAMRHDMGHKYAAR